MRTCTYVHGRCCWTDWLQQWLLATPELCEKVLLYFPFVQSCMSTSSFAPLGGFLQKYWRWSTQTSSDLKSRLELKLFSFPFLEGEILISTYTPSM
jgi:hypothetical protein